MKSCEGRSERAADRRPHVKGGREDPARGSGSQADGGRKQLTDEQQRQQARHGQLAKHDRLYRRVADAFYVIVTEVLLQQVDKDADQKHSQNMPYIGSFNSVELIFEEM